MNPMKKSRLRKLQQHMQKQIQIEDEFDDTRSDCDENMIYNSLAAKFLAIIGCHHCTLA